MGTGSVLWEVVAPVLRWPLWSPMRFFATLAACVVLLGIWSRATGPSGPSGPVELEAPRGASDTASEFMGAWGDPGAERGKWRSQVQALGTEELDRAWSRTDPADIPVSVVDKMTPVRVSETEVVFSIETDGPRVQLVTVKQPSGWRVASVEPEVRS